VKSAKLRIPGRMKEITASRLKPKMRAGAQSDWSDPLGVSMPKNKLLSNALFLDIPELERIFLSLFPLI
jgi:hypothetical protein